LLKRRKEELLNYNRKVFANIEKELPKFAEELGEDKKFKLA
jgi:sulfate adenylyltransferase subunit 1 (EFTu-like GTPase family)